MKKIIRPKKKNRFSRCYTLFILLAAKQIGVLNLPKDRWNKNGMGLSVMVIKEKLKKEFGIKSLRELKGKKLKEFEQFLESKL